MYKIAIIIFPGTNCHLESFRAVKNVGLAPEYFRWNDDYQKLQKFDGYFIAGGFSYEDRVRAGAIAARDPVMNIIREESLKGKPVLGICNGAQILVESGMIPGLSGHNLTTALAANNHGYLNIWVNIKNDQEQGRSAFTASFPQNEHFKLPMAHGEGRYVVNQQLLNKLIKNKQTVFRYCDENGNITEDYPVNPNGAVYNLAGVCNPEGNVLALMPHPERTGHAKIFESLKKYLEEKKENQKSATVLQSSAFSNQKIQGYKAVNGSLEIFVDLIITDNEAQTLTNALHQLGFDKVSVSKKKHWEVSFSGRSDFTQLTKELITSGELLNTNKEIAYLKFNKNIFKYSEGKLKKAGEIPEINEVNLLVRYQDDFLGQAKLNTLQNRLGIKSVKSVKSGIVWQIKIDAKTQAETKEVWQKIQETNILFNPFSQEAMVIGN